MNETRGTVIVGFPGIGKSTLANKDARVVDLESSNFMIYGNQRPPGWEKIYCNIARDLCRQGKIVFVSSHLEVREELTRHPAEHQMIVYPSTHLEKTWIQKLKDRYKKTKSDKDYRAYTYIKDHFRDAVVSLETSHPFVKVIITTSGYDLSDLIYRALPAVDDALIYYGGHDWSDNQDKDKVTMIW